MQQGVIKEMRANFTKSLEIWQQLSKSAGFNWFGKTCFRLLHCDSFSSVCNLLSWNLSCFSKLHDEFRMKVDNENFPLAGLCGYPTDASHDLYSVAWICIWKSRRKCNEIEKWNWKQPATPYNYTMDYQNGKLKKDTRCISIICMYSIHIFFF